MRMCFSVVTEMALASIFGVLFSASEREMGWIVARRPSRTSPAERL
jgi:hypothetical protein